MKILILGTSNSILGEKSYIQALRQHYEVIDLSADRVDIAFHRNRLPEHYRIVEAADLLIVEHDIKGLSCFETQYITDIGMMRCLDTLIIAALLPYAPHPSRATRFNGLTTTATRNLCLVDLSYIPLKAAHLLDEIHPKSEASYVFGMVLEREIVRLETLPYPSGGAVLATPLQRQPTPDLAPVANQPHQENQLMALDDLPLAAVVASSGLASCVPTMDVDIPGLIDALPLSATSALNPAIIDKLRAIALAVEFHNPIKDRTSVRVGTALRPDRPTIRTKSRDYDKCLATIEGT